MVLEKNSKISDILEMIHSRYNRKEFIYPDPLVFVLKYSNIYDKEVAGLISSSLALGRVDQILIAVEKVLLKTVTPFDYLKKSSYRDIENDFSDFSYRFFKTEQISSYLFSIGNIIRRYGSVGDFFYSSYSRERNLLKVLDLFHDEVISGAENSPGILITAPARGSACKRQFLFLRWLVRNDAIDPGGWDFVDKKDLLVPLDTHMMKIGHYLGFTGAKTASLKTAMEITDNFRCYDESDPVRFDFSLTRLGIHPDLNMEKLKYLEVSKK